MTSNPGSTLEMKVGQILVELGFLDNIKLEKALTIQRERKTYKPLGEICKELGFISGRELRNILSKYRKQILIGELLLKMGVISDDQLREAIEEQKKSREKLAQILIKKGFLTLSALADSLSIQLGIALYHPGNNIIDKTLFDKANVNFYGKKRVIPLQLDKSNRIVTILMEDPTDIETIDDLRKLFNADVELVICATGQIALLLKTVLDVWSDARRL
jgi:type IV pilus assembly protein PilB